MSDYSKNTNFTAKDTLATGNPSKKILGSELDAEFDEIAASVATKLDDPSGTLSTLAVDDTFLVGDTSTSTNKTITVQQLLDQKTYVPTATTTTGATSKEITGISSNAKRITVILYAVTSNSSSDLCQLEIGSGSYVTSGYAGSAWDTNSGTVAFGGSSFLLIPFMSGAAQTFSAQYVLTRVDPVTDTWVCSGQAAVRGTGTTYNAMCVGSKSLSGALDRLKIFTGGTLDGGQFNIIVEI